MAEYIEREALIQQMADNFRQASVDGCDNQFYQVAEDTILEAPAADVRYVIHSTWEITDIDHAYGHKCYHCPECGTDEWRYDSTNYCPNCGAKMDGGKHGQGKS